MTDRRRAAALAMVIILVLGLFVGVITVRSLVASAQDGTLDTACAAGTGGAEYTADSGLVVFEDDPDIVSGNFPGNETVDFGPIALSAPETARARLTDGTGNRTCLGSVSVAGSNLTVDPADGPTLTLRSNVSAFTYRDSITLASGDADLAYNSSTRPTRLTFLATGYEPGTTIAAVDAGTGRELARGTVQANGSLPLTLPEGDHSVDLRMPESVVGSVVLNQTIYSEARGDVARIGVQLSRADTATVTIGTVGENSYASNVTVRDGNGDDYVTVQFNTYTAGAGDETYGDGAAYVVYSVADPADEVVRVGESSGSFEPGSAHEATLDAGGYAISAVAGRVPASETDDGADAAATLTLGERSTDSVSTYVAPGARLDDLETAADIRAAVETGSLTETSEVAERDILVARIEASGLSGVLKNGTDTVHPNATAAFFAEARSHDGDPASAPWGLWMNRTDPAADAYSATLNAGNSRVIPQSGADSYWLLVDTARVPEFGTGDELRTNVTTFDEDGLNTVDTTVLDTWRFAGATAAVDTNADTDGDGDVDEVAVQKAAGQRITGTTNVAPGTELSIRVTGTDSGSPFVKPLTARVQPDGTWTATADFGGNAEGANFSVDVRRGSERLIEGVDGRIDDAPLARVTMNDQESFGDRVTVESVTTSDGGFVAIRRNNASGDVIGHSGYIEAGSESDLSITLDESLAEGETTLVAMVHRDTDGDQAYAFRFGSSVDAPYVVNGSAVTSSASATVTEPVRTTTAGGGEGSDGDGADGGDGLEMATTTDESASTTTDAAMATTTDGSASTDTMEMATTAGDGTDTTSNMETTDGSEESTDADRTSGGTNDGSGGERAPGGATTDGDGGGGGGIGTTAAGPGFGIVVAVVVLLSVGVYLRREL